MVLFAEDEALTANIISQSVKIWCIKYGIYMY